MLTRFFLGNEVLAANPGKDCSLFLSTHSDQIAFLSIGGLLSSLITALIIVSGLATLVFMALGGVQYLTSGGDKAQTQAARERITYAIMGLAIVVSVVAVNQVIGAVFGINIFGTIAWPTVGNMVGDYVARFGSPCL